MTVPRPGVQERILLHLRDYVDYADKVEVPFAISQMGIANAVAIARSNVPRAIAGMKESGHLIERQAHVSGVSRKRKAYFLTSDGVNLADDIWVKVSEQPVRLIHADGDAENLDLRAALESTELPLRHVDILRYLDHSGTVDLSTLSPDLIERDLSKHIEKQLVNSLNDLPRMRRFFGRDLEINRMADILEAESTTLLVPGIAGIGKTALAAKLLERFTHRRNMLYHRCQDWEGSRAFLEACAEWLSMIGNNDLSDYVSSTPVPQVNMAVNLIVEGLENSPALIVIDDLHKVADENFVAILGGLTLRVPDSNELGLVMFSRSFRMVVPEADSSGTTITHFIPLEGLDQDSSRQILTAMPDIDLQQFLHIYTLSRGHPLVLELINRGSVGETFHATLEAFVEKEIFSKLSGPQKRLLGAIGVFREPMPLESLIGLNADIDLLDDLVEKGLARRIDTDFYDVHDLVREFLVRSMDESLKAELHTNAVEWYRTRTETAAEKIEFIHHLNASGDLETLAEVLQRSGRGLVKSGHIELLGILRSLESDGFDAVHWGLIRELRGDILSLQGRWVEAEEEYAAAIPVARKHKRATSLARMMTARADIAVKRGAVDDALELHRQALEIQLAARDAVGAARSYINMG